MSKLDETYLMIKIIDAGLDADKIMPIVLVDIAKSLAMIADKMCDTDYSKYDITECIKSLDSLPAERKKELDILYDYWFKKAFGVDPETFKKEEE